MLRAAGPDPSAVEIVDIKTAKNRPPLPQHQNRLRVYAQEARTLGLNPVGLAIHDLDSEDGAAIPVEEDPRELGAFEEDMCRWVHGIRTARFMPRCKRVPCSALTTSAFVGRTAGCTMVRGASR